jgi:hypothetical protein
MIKIDSSNSTLTSFKTTVYASQVVENLIKRKWQGSGKCCFCDKKETKQHLFLQCPLAKIVWRIVHMAFSIIPPKNIKNLFGNWLVGVSKIEKAHIRVGTCALLWAIWRIKNDYILPPFLYIGGIVFCTNINA